MARFYGPIGFSKSVETDPVNHPGVFEEVLTEHNYYGEVIRNTKRNDAGSSVNDNINVGNTISIIADAYANQNFFAMRYLKWMGSYWKITNVEVQRPRLILSIGGVYNGKQA